MYDISDNLSYIQPARANTRQAERITFTTEIVKYDIYHISPYYTGTGLWNNLPTETQKKESKCEFKKAIRILYGNQV